MQTKILLLIFACIILLLASCSTKVQKSNDRDIKNAFTKAGLNYAPRQVAFVSFKQERVLEVWAKQGPNWLFIQRYPILAASGRLGPKLREGDFQVPEGIYKVSYLNPNSRFHLSMKLNYPNAFDLKYAQLEGRDQPGTNIFIHGDKKSTGCLAMGNKVIEELYALVETMGVNNIQVIIAPYDMRKTSIRINRATQPTWLPELYRNIKHALKPFPT